MLSLMTYPFSFKIHPASVYTLSIIVTAYDGILN